jgi:hypothetical protein
MRDTGTGGELWVNTTSGGVAGTAWTQLAAAGGNSLQQAYVVGNVIDVESGEGTITFTNTNDNQPVLLVNNQGTGNTLEVQDNGTANLTVSGAGAVSVTPTSGQNLTLTTAGAGVLDIDSASGGIDITSTGDVAISAGTAGSATALVLDDGTNTYLTLDSTDQQLELGQFLDTGANVGQGLTYANNSGAQIDVAKLVATDNATTLQVIEADGTGGSATNLTSRITGVAMEDIANAGSGKIHTAHGAHVNVSFTASVSTSNIGQVVYLDTTGDATLTAPSASGDFVVEVGILQRASSVDPTGKNVARVLYAPRFVAAVA